MTRQTLTAFSLSVLLLPSCGGRASKDMGGESNWLRPCVVDQDCDGGDVCDAELCRPSAAATVTTAPSDAMPNALGNDDAERLDGVPSIDPDYPEPPEGAVLPVTAPFGGDPPLPAGTVTDLGPACAYPGAVDWAALSPITWSERIPFWEGTLDASCQLELSPLATLTPLNDQNPASLPDDPERVTHLGGYPSWSADLNLDGVGDFVFSLETDEWTSRRVQIFWVSELSEGQLRFGQYRCDSFTEVTGWRGIHPVDADGDGVKDLLREANNGVELLLNTPDGFVSVAEFSFGDVDSVDVTEVQFAELDGQPGAEMVLGLNRRSAGERDSGVVVVRWGLAEAPRTLASWWSDPLGAPADPEQDTYSGQFFIVDRDGDGQLELSLMTTSGRARQMDLRGGEAAPGREVIGETPLLESRAAVTHKVWSLQGEAMSPVLVGVLGDELTLYGSAGLVEYGGLQPVFDPLAGPRLATERWHVGDVNADHGVDFLELNPLDADTFTAPRYQLAVHFGDLLAHFSPPQVIELPRYWTGLPSAMIPIGDRRLGLLVYHGGNLDTEPSPGQYETRYFPSSFQQVRCAQ